MRRKASIGLGIALAGCAEHAPERVTVGVGARQIRASRWPVKFDENIPFVRVEGTRGINDELDVKYWVDLIEGEVGAERYKMEGNFVGGAGAFGVGVRYFPFDSRVFGLDAGVETFQVSGSITGDFHGLKDKFSEEFWGYGAHVGATVEFHLFRDKNGSISGGYNFTDTFGSNDGVNYDFDGPFVFIRVPIGE